MVLAAVVSALASLALGAALWRSSGGQAQQQQQPPAVAQLQGLPGGRAAGYQPLSAGPRPAASLSRASSMQAAPGI